MLKKEFLDVLNQKLSLISDKEREDIILEYGTYIDDKIAGGVAEEEAVAGFGDVDELVKDILDAYKINTDSMDPFSNRADKTIDKVYAKVEELFSKLGNFSMNEIFHLSLIHIYHNMLEEVEEKGVIFLDTDSALKACPDLLKEYFGKLVPYTDNKYAALNLSLIHI